MSSQINIQAQTRDLNGTADSRRLRHTGKFPAVLYGAGKDNEHLVLTQNEMMHNLEKEGFSASILSVKTEKGTQQAILRDVQMHPYKAQIMHIDFMRIRASEAMTIKVPIHLVGQDEAPGLKLEDGILTQSVHDIDITCLPKDLPDYLEVDISNLGLHESRHMSDIVLPEGVNLTAFMYIEVTDEQALQDANHPVVSIIPPRAVTEEEIEDEDEDEDGDVEKDIETDDDSESGEKPKED